MAAPRQALRRLEVWTARRVGFSPRGSIELRRTDFKGDRFPFTSAGASRTDRTRILRVSIFNRAFTLRGFSPQLVLVNEVRKSNAQLHHYRRNRAELQFVRQFQAEVPRVRQSSTGRSRSFFSAFGSSRRRMAASQV